MWDARKKDRPSVRAAAFEGLEPRQLLSAGDPDLSFGMGGRASTGVSAITHEGMDVALQADGKTVVVGYDAPAGTTFVSADTPADFVVRRFNADGTPDASFGTNGVVTTDFFGRADQALTVAIDSRGRIVVAGKVQPQGTIYPRFGFARYLPSGKPDDSFGDGGKVLGVTENTDGVRGLAITADDSIVAGGAHYGATGQNMLVEKLTSDGKPDANFQGGAVEINIRQNATGDVLSQDYILGLAIAPGGKIVVAGHCTWPSNVTPPDNRSSDVALARLLTTGELDPTFGDGGKGAYDFGKSEMALGVVVLPDGSLWLAGRSGSVSSQVSSLYRFTAAGQPDTSFDGDGLKTVSNLTVTDIAAGPGGTVLLGGSSPGTYPEIGFGVWRFTSAGAPDANFGSAGLAKIDLLAGGADTARALAVRADGSVVLAGYVPIGAKNNEVGVARLTSSGMPDASFGTGGKVVTGANVFPGAGYAVAQQADGKYLIAGLSDDSYTPGFRLTRFNADGTLDTTFGDRGTVKTTIGTEEADATAVIVRSDGKIWVGGYAYTENSSFTLVTVPVVARYLSNGQPDKTFDGDGVKMFAIGSVGDRATSSEMILQPDGKLVLAGSGRRVGSTDTDSFLMRIDENGNLDPNFGNGGVTWQSLGVTDSLSNLIAVPGDAPGLVDLIVTGSVRAFVGSYYEYDAVVARFDDDGSLEWNNTLDFTRNDLVTAAAVNPADGSILLAGHTSTSGGYDHLFLAKLDAAGNRDGSFGTGGYRDIPFNQAYPWLNGAVFDAQGGIVVAGYNDTSATSDFLLMRFLSDGTPDANFGTNGRATLDVLGQNDRINAMLRQDDGKLVVVGASYDATYAQDVVAIARFRGVETLPVVTEKLFRYDGAGGAPHSVRFTFDTAVTAVAQDGWQLQNLTRGATIAPADIAVNFDAPTRTATLTFPNLPGGILPDGNYRVTLQAGSLQDDAGNALGSDVTLDFFVLAGDANHDRHVDFNDLVALAQHYNTVGGMTFAQGDFNLDGNVDFNDLVILAQRYNTSLPAPGAGAAQVIASASFASDWAAATAPSVSQVAPVPTPKVMEKPKSTPKAIFNVHPPIARRPVATSGAILKRKS
jgi:uncharacterized delta-60 repeat protein